MKLLWLIFLPLLYFPNLTSGKTTFGELEFSDFLIGPFLLLVNLAGRRRKLFVGQVRLFLFLFIGWALFSTLLIRERYGYPDDHQVTFAVLKLCKFTLYSTAGLLAVRAVAEERQSRWFYWSLLAVGVVVAFSLARSANFGSVARRIGSAARDVNEVAGYKASNSISVVMSMFICGLGVYWLDGHGSKRWRQLAVPAMALMVLGWFLSDGRGGWLAGLVGALYIFYRRGLGILVSRRRLGFRLFIGLIGAGMLTAVAYSTLPAFRKAIDRTINPPKDYLRGDWQVIEGVDDGGRLSTWAHEGVKLAASPLLGTGFCHHGAASGLFSTGSHNFWLQMFLETGVVGGTLILGMFVMMWKQAGTGAARTAGSDVAVRASLVAAFIGGLSGEYFYGGVELLSLFLVYAPVGCLSDPSGLNRESMDSPGTSLTNTPLSS